MHIAKEEATSIPGKSFSQKARTCLANITVEPLIVLYLFPSVLLAMSAANLHLEKACRVKLQLNETVCDALTARNASAYTSEQENLVQKVVTAMNAWKSIIQSVIPACLLLLFGAWSDKHNRRKPLMALPIIGEFITVTGFIFCTYFFYELSMEFTGLVETVPNAFTGSWFTMFMAVMSLIGCTSSLESRTVKIGAVNILMNTCIMLGLGLSGALYHVIGSYAIYCFALSMYTIGLIYLKIRIKEAKTEASGDEGLKSDRSGTFKDFFNVLHIKDTIMVAFRQRKRNDRKRLFVILTLTILVLGPMYGEMQVVYLFTRKQFQWNEVEFSAFFSVNIVLHCVGTIVALAVLSKYLKLRDTTVGMICYTGKFFAAFLYAFARTPLLYCLGVFVEMLSSTTHITLRSLATKLVSEDEQGKLNALVTVFESLLPLAFGSMYNLVYRATIDTLPGTFYFLGSIMCVPAMGLYAWLYIQENKDAREAQNRESIPLQRNHLE
ncbi:solute carrier family 46 member 3-like isoform X2 [Photinus pyralis]|uniref:Major facilitator superfamily (MFS) profile domain-containing protein n=2 Tax=Photinus pyralis TaxID=7054 RepID=A0A1Y1KXR9_PHOPY|nr:solute carrier family 46 member 3-like isoform X2 [Photinus pyralis]XP_031333164.1 solute carrier family 46 member 3-like isoform X2 [Photinus pyralis]